MSNEENLQGVVDDLDHAMIIVTKLLARNTAPEYRYALRKLAITADRISESICSVRDVMNSETPCSVSAITS
jgi:hypothetical protein